MRVGIIYRATNLINGKCYIGQTVLGLKKRIQLHIAAAYRKNNGCYNTKFYRAIRKHGDQNFKWDILTKASQDQLNLLEKSYIWGLSTYEFGYNSTLGGDGVICERTVEHNRKISESNKGKRNSPETRQKISISVKAYFAQNPQKPMSAETKRKLSNSRKGMKFSEEHIKNLSLSHIGQISSMKGKKLSKEHRKKLSESWFRSEECLKQVALKNQKRWEEKGKLFKVFCDGIEIGEWRSQSACARTLNISPSVISLCLSGKFKTCKGYSFIYV